MCGAFPLAVAAIASRRGKASELPACLSGRCETGEAKMVGREREGDRTATGMAGGTRALGLQDR
jgi:hypothetical protein